MRLTICPECYQSKHLNCNGDALDETRDEITRCSCDQAKHETCCHCGDPLFKDHCTDGLGHCEGCERACVVCAPERRDQACAD